MATTLCISDCAGTVESDSELGVEEVHVWMVGARLVPTLCSNHSQITEPVLGTLLSQRHPAPDRHHLLHDVVVHPLRRRLLLAHLHPPRDTSIRYTR